MSERYQSLTSPLRIRGKVMKSRFMYPTAQVHFLQGPETYPGDPVISYYEDFAKQGQALIVTQELAKPDQRKQKGHDSKHFCQYDLYDPGAQNYFTQFAHFMHCQNSFVAVEFSNLELRMNYSVNDPEAPKPERKGPGGFPGMGGPGGPGGNGKRNPMEIMREWKDPEGPSPGAVGFPGSPCPRTIFLKGEKMQEFFDTQIARAKLYKSFGYDGLVIDMGRDFLCGEFLSETSNYRTDEYGPQSLDNRIRFPLEYLAALRKGLGDDFLIIVYAPAIGTAGPFGGMSKEDAAYFFNKMGDTVDVIRLGGMGMPGAAEDPNSRNCPNAEYTKFFKAQGCPQVFAINNPGMDLDWLEDIIKDGGADMIVAGRMFICNHDIGKILQEGNGEELEPCIECGICRGSSAQGDWMSHCTINPWLGMSQRAYRLIEPVEKKKKVAIIGGGPGGVKCGLYCADRGHDVTIFEAGSRIGGQIAASAMADFKWKLDRYLKHQEGQIARRDNITLKLNTFATPELIKEGGYDVVIAATGATPKKPNIPGVENAKWDTVSIYGHADEVGHRVVVIGGNSSPVEGATYLAKAGHEVTVLTRNTIVGNDLNPINARGNCGRTALNAGVDIIIEAKTLKIEPGKVTYEKNGETFEIECDDVLAAGGMDPNSDAAIKFYGSAPEFYMIGDCREAGSMRTAIRDAWTTAMRI